MRGEINHRVERWDTRSKSWIPLTYPAGNGSSLELSVMGSLQYCNGWVDGARLHVHPSVAVLVRYRVAPVLTGCPDKD